MATLNIKEFPDDLYAQLRELASEEQRSIAEQVTHLLSESLQPPPHHSILELRGLGKEAWRGGEAAGHVNRERRSWD